MGAGGGDRPSRDAAAGPARAARRQVKPARAPAGGAALRPVPSAAPSVHVCASTARGADSVVAQRPGAGGSRDSAPGVLRGTARRDRRSGSRALPPDVPNDLPRPHVRFPKTETGLGSPSRAAGKCRPTPPRPGTPCAPRSGHPGARFGGVPLCDPAAPPGAGASGAPGEAGPGRPPPERFWLRRIWGEATLRHGGGAGGRGPGGAGAGRAERGFRGARGRNDAGACPTRGTLLSVLPRT